VEQGKSQASILDRRTFGLLLRHHRVGRSDVLTSLAAVLMEITGFLITDGRLQLSGQWQWVIPYLIVPLPILTWRHRAPLLALALLITHQLMIIPLFHGETHDEWGPWLPMVGVLVALAAVSADLPVGYSLSACVPTLALPLLASGQGLHLDEPYYLGSALLITTGTWAFGRLMASNRKRISALESARLSTEAAVAQERVHIAAELHDIVSHAVTVMMLHAAGGRKVIETDPQRAAHALAVIESVGTEATQELARLLGLLKPPPDAVRDDQQTPLPVLKDIDPLIATFRSAGVQVDLKQTGQAARLDPSVGHAAYRVIQEALTNVSKHAGPGTRAAVVIQWAPDNLTITIKDDGAGTPARRSIGHTPGFGLLGLKERVQVAGGSICWERADGGFSLAVTLPTGRQDREEQGQPPRLSA
jgi:signal transduction histidine kinase